MRRAKIFCLGLVLIALTSVNGLAQSGLAALEGFAKATEQLIQHEKPGWKFKRIEPIAGSEGVIIDQWSFPRGSVRVSIIVHKSVAEAREAVQDLARTMRAERLTSGIGEEGYSWGMAGNHDGLMNGI